MERPVSGTGNGSEPSLDLGEFAQILTSRVRLLIPCMALALGVAGAYVALAPTTYTATMSILVDPRERVPVGIDAAPLPQNPDAALVESQMRLMTSLPVLRKVVDEQHLADARPSALGSLIAAARAALGGQPVSADARREAAAEALEQSVSLKRSERTYVIDVEVKGRTRDKAKEIAQSLADAYLAAKAQFTDEVADKERAFLDSKLEEMRKRVEAAERKAQVYRDENALVVSDGKTAPEQRLKDANTALVVAQGKLADVQARYKQIRAALSAGIDERAVNDNLRSPVIEKLRSDYAALARDEAYAQSVLGPRHPSYVTIQKQLESVRAQIRAEQRRVAEATEREIQSAREAERSAATLVTTLESSTNKLGDKRVELNELDRAASALRAAYEKALTARQNVRRDAISSPLALLISPPSAPLAPSSPKKLAAFIVAFVAGLNLWVLAALVSEYRRRRANRPPAPTPPRTEGAYRAAPAASVGAAAVNPKRWPPPRETIEIEMPELPSPRPPSARRGSARAARGLAAVAPAMRGDNPYSAEARVLLDHVLESVADAGRTPFIAVAGAAPGAGASTTVLSLAHAACEDGLRTLVVDRNRRAPDISDFAEDFEPVALARSGGRARMLRRDRKGEALVVAVSGGDGSGGGPDCDDDAFDLVIIDCEDFDSAARLVRESAAVDGFLAVAARSADPEAMEKRLDALGLFDHALAIVFTPASAGRAG